MSTKKQGFASLSKAKLRKVSSKGGSKQVPKGFATIPREDRIVIARNAANARWEKARREKQGESPINSKEDGRVQETES